MTGMDGKIDLKAADRDVLIGIIVRQQAIIARLEKRVAQLEGRAKFKGSGRMPGLKPKADRKSSPSPRKQRPHGFARVKTTPTERVEHAVGSCRDCGADLAGGWVPRAREIIDLPQVPVQVPELVYIARTCPACGRRCVPSPELDGMVLGKGRLGINLISLIAALREEGRLPIRAIQWYLHTVHGLRLSVGAIVSVLRRISQKAQDAVAQIRASPVVHADATGWREDGRNGYVWTFSAPNQRYFLRRNRSKTVVDEVLDRATGALGLRFLLRLPPLRQPHTALLGSPATGHSRLAGPLTDAVPLAQWADAVQQLYRQAKAFTYPHQGQRHAAQRTLERRLLTICQPFLDDPSAAQSKLCRRIQRHIKERFVLVAEPDVPPDNNAAERSRRHLVISRKISGGTRSQQGTQSKMTLTSLFGTWRAQGRNPLTSCRQLLASPQV